ncbi:MFS transporter [Sphaerisporangium sp. TRM90804]|uniref:MFS transporter n=1 Tax=Sphaerisporangium sp. TRM90804 TaxID=3031113 RepID=UPI002448A04B|nr:MFS transporter [Sphaerisporangium sp. TRM90804]MDH2425040.1 MFS transporter [Sphaerisporangium sp. TRM90804]
MSVPRWARVSPVGVAYAAFILIGVSAGVGGVLLPAQIRDYGVDKAVIGTTFFAFSAGFLLAGSTSGALIHRFGIRTSLAVGGGVFVVAGLYTAVRPPFLAFVAVQVVAGYGTGLMESVLNTYLADLPRARTLLNRLHAFFGVGALAGPLLATWMLRHLPWTAVWLALGLACLPLVAGFVLTLRAHPPAPRERAPADVAPAGPVSTSTGPALTAPIPAAPAATGGGMLGTALREPAVLLGAVFLAVYVGLEVGVGNWAFTFLVDEHGQSDLVAGYTVSGYWLGLALGRFLISPAATRLGWTATGMTFACLAGVTASAALTWLAPVPAVAAVSLVLLGFWLGPVFPTTMAVTPRMTTARLVPTAIGVLNGVSVIGGAVFPWLAGVFAEGMGVWTLPPFTLTLALLLTVVWGLVVARMAATPRSSV